MNKLSQIVKDDKNVMFSKPGCPFCAASYVLLDELVKQGVIPNYTKYFNVGDFSDPELTELVTEYGWQKESEYQVNCTKPQIFINGEYIGGNWELYLSKWNITGLKNPMPF
jgi:glutaredoxin